jgi:hypothetical protein
MIQKNDQKYSYQKNINERGSLAVLEHQPRIYMKWRIAMIHFSCFFEIV